MVRERNPDTWFASWASSDMSVYYNAMQQVSTRPPALHDRMKRFFEDMNPTLRGFLIVAAVVVAIASLYPLQIGFSIIFTIAQILLFFAICFLVYRWWREHRGEIDLWSTRAKWTFYAGAALVVVELARASFIGALGLGIHLAGVPLLAWILGVAIGVYAMWRVWQDEHSYGDY